MLLASRKTFAYVIRFVRFYLFFNFCNATMLSDNEQQIILGNEKYAQSNRDSSRLG